MVNAKKVFKYLCPICKSPCDDELEAQECCTDVIEEVKMYQCSECDDLYYEKSEANECCKEEDI